MNPSQNPEQVKAQMQEQLRVTTFLFDQKQAMIAANSKMLDALNLSVDDLSSVFTLPVVEAYRENIGVQNRQLEWELNNLTAQKATLVEILAQLESPILRVMPMPTPPPGPRNIR